MNQSPRSLRLPSTLLELHFGLEWNLTVDELPSLPAHLQLLAFGERFNHSVASLQLPSSLRTLSFGSGFNQPLHQLRLPSSLYSFSIGSANLSFLPPFDRPVAELPRLPEGLRLLQAPKRLLDGAFASLELPPHCVVHAM